MSTLLVQIIDFLVLPFLSLLMFVFFAYVIMSWLFILNIVSHSNPTARQVFSILSSVVEPIITPLRRIVPPLGSLDLAFFFGFMIIYFLKNGIILGMIRPALG